MFTRLQREGFVFGVDTHLRIQTLLQDFGKEILDKPEQLKFLLGPVIAHSLDAKLKFYNAFDDFIEEIEQKKQAFPIESESIKETLLEKNKRVLRKSQILNSLIFIVLPLLAILGITFSTVILPYFSKPKAHFHIKSPDGMRFPDASIPKTQIPDTFHVRRYIGEELSFHIERESIPWQLYNTELHWDFGDGNKEITTDSSAFFEPHKKPYFTQGTFLVKLTIYNKADSSNNLYGHAYLSIECLETNFTVEKTILDIGEETRFFALGVRNYSLDEFSFIWDLGDGSTQKGEQITHIYKNPGDYTVSVQANRLTPIGVDCYDNPRGEIKIIVKDSSATNAVNLIEEKDNASFLYTYSSSAIGLVSFLLSGLFLGILFLIKFLTYKAPQIEDPHLFSNSQEGPYTIKLPRQNHLISHERDIYSLAEIMRQRRMGNIKRINLPISIQTTIRESGFPKLYYDIYSRPSEYLVLIEQSHPESHLSRFLDRVMEILTGEDVLIETFFFDSDPRNCWNNTYPEGLRLEELARKYPKHRLLLISPGHQLIDSHSPILKAWVEPAFEVWKENRVILTQIPVIDWGFRERILMGMMDVLPLDISGQLHMIQMFDDIGQPPFEDHKKQLLNLYPETRRGMKTYDLYSLEGLHSYLGESDFEWLAACMVYPYPTWEVTLAIGNELSHEKECSFLTYEKLLKIARIPWMQTGDLPRELREELLAKLSPETERLARQTVLELLAQVPIEQDSFASHQIALQTTTHQFYINPANETFAKQMYSLMKAEQIVDPVEKSRLESKTGILFGSKASQYLNNQFGILKPREYLLGGILGFITVVILSFWLSNIPGQEFQKVQWLADEEGVTNLWLNPYIPLDSIDSLNLSEDSLANENIATIPVDEISLKKDTVGSREDSLTNIGNEPVPEESSSNTSGPVIGQNSPASNSSLFKVGIIRYKTPKALVETYGPLLNFLGKELGKQVSLDTVSENELASKLSKGEYDLGIFTPFPYLRAKIDFPELEVFASHTVSGGDSYSGCIVIRKESGINSLHELKKRNFLFVKPTSTSGYKYPKGIFKERNLDIDAGFFNYNFSGGHDRSLKALIDQEVDGIAIDTRVYNTLNDTMKDSYQMLECYEVPYHAYVLNPTFGNALGSRLKDIMFQAHKNPENKKLFKNPLHLEKWHPQSDDAYNSLRRYLRIVRVKPSLQVEWEIRPAAKRILDKRGDVLDLLKEGSMNKLRSTQRFKAVSEMNPNGLMENSKIIKVTLATIDQELLYNFYFENEQIGTGDLSEQNIVAELPTKLVQDVLNANVIETQLLFNGKDWFVTYGSDDGILPGEYEFEIHGESGSTLVSHEQISEITPLNTFFTLPNDEIMKEGQKVIIRYAGSDLGGINNAQDYSFWDNLDNRWGVFGLLIAFLSLVIGAFFKRKKKSKNE